MSLLISEPKRGTASAILEVKFKYKCGVRIRRAAIPGCLEPDDKRPSGSTKSPNLAILQKQPTLRSERNLLSVSRLGPVKSWDACS